MTPITRNNLSYDIRRLQSADVPKVLRLLKDANYGHMIPAFRLVMKHKLVQYILIIVSVATYAYTRSIYLFLLVISIFISLCFLVTFLGALLYIYGGTLEDLKIAEKIYISNPDCGFFVAVINGNIIGTIAVVKKDGCHDNTAWLRRMAVDRRYRKFGVAKKLCEVAIEFCRERNYSYIELITTDLHLAARRLYMKLGFKCVDYKPYTYLNELIHIWTYEFRYTL